MTDAERRITEWPGLLGPRPTDAKLADYLQSLLDDREEVDAVDAAVMREAVRALRERGERASNQSVTASEPVPGSLSGDHSPVSVGSRTTITTPQPSALPSEEEIITLLKQRLVIQFIDARDLARAILDLIKRSQP